GPVISHDVVHDHHEDVMLLSEAQQTHSHQGAGLKIERLLRRLFDETRNFLIALAFRQALKIDGPEIQRRLLIHYLPWLALKNNKTRAQRFMPEHDLVQ